MNYHQEILDKLRNSKNWPQFERGDYLTDLFEIADNAFDKHTIEGYLASTLIYHQLTEEFLLLLIENSNFLLQCSVFPAEYRPMTKKNLMFGAVLDEFKKTVRFEDTIDLIELCKKLNSVRINLVHKLAKSESIETALEDAKKIKDLFGMIARYFSDIDDEFKEAFRHYKKNIEDMENLLDDLKNG